jgi:hypothetical protein
MCGILAGTNPATLELLWEENQARGPQGMSYSILADGNIHQIYKGSAEINQSELLESVAIPDPDFHIYHFVTPTGDLNYHPAVGYYRIQLWHNGMLLTSDIDRLSKKWSSRSDWDTQLLAWELDDNPNNLSQVLSSIQGTFACLLYHPLKGLFCFRSSSCPLFLGSNFISSVRPKNIPATPILENTIFQLNLSLGRTLVLNPIESFTPKLSPYSL